MAASGFTPISLYYSTTAAAAPVNTNLVNGELAINITDGKLYYKDNSGVVQTLATKGGVGSSTNTQVLYNSSGLVVGSSNLTFNGTTLSANTLNLTNALGAAYGGTGLTSLGTGVATFLGTPTSANLAAAVSDETGTGFLVFATSPTLVTPLLGTPTSGTLSNCTGLPVSTGISGLGTGVSTALAVNTGSAGAVVLFNGALGTPTSGTVTNLTGTASININGTVGATTPTTGSFTTLTTTGGINTRVTAIADGTSITMNADTTDLATQANTQAAGTLTVNAPSGTPVNGQKISLRLTSTNVQTFSWNAIFAGSTDQALPTASSGASKTDYMGFIYNSTAAKWQMLAKTFGF